MTILTMKKAKSLHPNNLHNDRYDLESLEKSLSSLSKYIITNQYDDKSIDFSDAESVLELNKAILKHYYALEYWTIPKGHLCPPIPGRVDYIHYITEKFNLKESDKGLDIGTGTGCIYPILGFKVYGLNFVASDINLESLEASQNILQRNQLTKNIELRHQKNKASIFENIIEPNDYFHFTMCNPPFHSSKEQADKASSRKNKNLDKNKLKKGHRTSESKGLNFGGKNAELWCKGGELEFITRMIQESPKFKRNIKHFTTLVSKKENLPKLIGLLEREFAQNIDTIQMNQGHKITHILTWSFS